MCFLNVSLFVLIFRLVTCLVLVSMFHSHVTVSIAQGNNAGEDFGKLEEGNRTDQSD